MRENSFTAFWSGQKTQRGASSFFPLVTPLSDKEDLKLDSLFQTLSLEIGYIYILYHQISYIFAKKTTFLVQWKMLKL